MSMLHVHNLQPFSAEAEADLRSQLADNIVYTAGDGVSAEATILISGSPSAEQLRAIPALQAVIVPWAGPPKSLHTLLLSDFPGVTLHNLHHNAPMTAEQNLALLLAAARDLIPSDRHIRNNDWTTRFPIPSGRAILLEGKTALVLGYGEIGQRVARGCKGLGMHVVAVKRTPAAPDRIADEIVTIDTLQQQLPRADALLICLPGTAETRDLITASELALLPQTCIIVNTGRGNIINESALFHALRDRRIFAAGLDVWWQYPPTDAEFPDYAPSAYPFNELDNVVMTPHKGGDALEVDLLRMQHLSRMLNTAAAGEPLPNRIDLTRGY